MPTARLMAFRFVATTSWPPPSARHGHVARSPRPTSRTTTLRPCATFSATTWVLQTQRSGDSFGPDQELTSFSSQLNEVSRTRFCWCVCVCLCVCVLLLVHTCAHQGGSMFTPLFFTALKNHSLKSCAAAQVLQGKRQKVDLTDNVLCSSRGF